jgi:PTS system nitrogen regulatory IIA component
MKLRIGELAQRLELPLRTLDRWIRQGRIPVHREGDHIVFKKTVLERWASTHNLGLSAGSAERSKDTEPDLENLLPVMQRGGVFYDLAADDVDAALEAAAGQISAISESDRASLLAGLKEREQMTSTGIGKGVAIPHPRTPIAGVIDQARILTVFLQRAIDFHAVDDRPVFVLFLMLSPSIKTHLHLLSRLSFCIRDDGFIDFLRGRPEPSALFERIAEFEAALDSAES